MPIKPVLKMGHPKLRQISQEIPLDKIQSAEVKSIAQDMTDTMAHLNGLGIAAPQIGENIRMAIVGLQGNNPRYGDMPSFPSTLMINPIVKPLTNDRIGFWEGCLSVPNIKGYVERSRRIMLEYYNANGEKVSLETEDLLAIVIQHELDHLDGHLFIDRVEDKAKLAFSEEYQRFWASI